MPQHAEGGPGQGRKEVEVRLSLLITAALLALLASFVQASTLHPALEARMETLRDDEPISVIVHMTEQAPIAELNRQLRAEGATRQERHQRVIEALQLAAQSQAPFVASLEAAKSAGGVRGFTPYWISNLVVIECSKDEIYRIASRSDVDFVELNFTTTLIRPVGERAVGMMDEDVPETRGIGVTPGMRAIRADLVWHELGLNGTGTLIGSLDTGVDGLHPALTSRWRGNHASWQECWLDLLGTATTYPNDQYGHGTHTTGTMTGVAPDDTIGVAWGAEWIATNPIDQGVSSAFDNDILASFQWFADPDGVPGTTDDVPDVVQNSWGVYEAFGYPDCDSRWWAVIDNCEAAGVATCWSAGNEGTSGAGSLRSPADRATTLTNAFSVGAVDATSYGWPYPIAYFSSLGPSGCSVPPDQKIKPEVAAPGVTVYSSVPGGGFEQSGWDGTSMAGPHVAGTMALMRQANPDIDVDMIKTILMETARDEGTVGEDNTYGHGFIDAHAAVLAAMTGFGQLAGTVTNGSYGGAVLPGAQVELVGTAYHWPSGADGAYHGYAQPGTYTARATLAGFAPLEYSVELIGNQVTNQDFSLTDIAGPQIASVTGPTATTDAVGPYTISADILDYSSVASAKLFYRVSGGLWTETSMASRGVYEGSIPGAPANTQIDYYIWAEDGIGLESMNPPDAPATYFSIYVTETLYAHDAEDPGDAAWQLGMAGDAATTGIWVRVDPNGTSYSGVPMQPENDHTAAPGVKCFVTGQGAVGGGAGDADVDGGCTSLRSPIFDLSTMSQAFVRYWRWYGEGGASSDDEFAVDVSDDGGASWVPLERVPGIENQWTEVVADLGDYIDLTGQVVFRFVACDVNNPGLTEAGIDDFAIETFLGIDTDVALSDEAARGARLFSSRPNPYTSGRGEVTVRFNLAQSERVEVKVYDLAGRVVATLADGRFSSGEHRLSWDGRGAAGEEVASGVYFCRLKSGSRVETSRLTIVH
jgi:subtilisin family serine protease